MGVWDTNVFVTGPNGFVGPWVIKDVLGKGAKVFALVKEDIKGSMFNEIKNNNLVVVRGDVRDYDLLKRVISGNDIRICIHLAAQSTVTIANKSPLETLETNIRGTYYLLEALRNSEAERIVVASSDKAYGTQKLPYKEDDELKGLYPYDASKVCLDVLARTYANTYGMPLAVTRCCNIFGGGDMNPNIVPDTLKKVLKNENPVIRSDGTPVRQYLYIKDAVYAYTLLTEKLLDEKVKGEAFNFGSSDPISVMDLVNLILRLTGKENLKPEILGTAKREIDEQYLSSEKAKKLLNWEPKYSLEDGLKETIEWYKRHLK